MSVAVWRFELFIKGFLEVDGWNGLGPLPLDVGLVWHAYALNPRYDLLLPSESIRDSLSLIPDGTKKILKETFKVWLL